MNEFVIAVGVAWDEGSSRNRIIAPISYGRSFGMSIAASDAEKKSLADEMGLSGGSSEHGFILFSHPDFGILRLDHVNGEVRAMRVDRRGEVMGTATIPLPMNVTPVIADIGSRGGTFFILETMGFRTTRESFYSSTPLPTDHDLPEGAERRGFSGLVPFLDSLLDVED